MGTKLSNELGQTYTVRSIQRCVFNVQDTK